MSTIPHHHIDVGKVPAVMKCHKKIYPPNTKPQRSQYSFDDVIILNNQIYHK